MGGRLKSLDPYATAYRTTRFNMSKLPADSLKSNIQSVLDAAAAKKRKFVETIELQVVLKNYDTQKDKRFAGSIKLPNIPRPRMSCCILGDAKHVEAAKAAGIPCMDVESLKALNKDKKKVKKLAQKYSFFLASQSVLKQIPRLLGPTMHKLGKFPTLVEHGEDITEKIDSIRGTVKFQLKKVLTMGVAAAHVGMSPDQCYANIMITINFLVSLLKKNWQNIKTLNIKSTMGPAHRVF